MSRLICLSLSILLATSEIFAQNTWKLTRDRNGIQVFTRKNSKSSVKDSKTEAVIDASIDEIYELMTDFNNHKEWMDKVGESRLLKQVSDREFYVYYVGVAPWPISSRDVVAHYTITKDGGKIRFEAVGDPDYLPLKQDMIRIPKTESWWEFIPLSNKKVKLTYYISTDPGGVVPSWLTNIAAEDTPFDTVYRLKQKLESKPPSSQPLN